MKPRGMWQLRFYTHKQKVECWPLLLPPRSLCPPVSLLVSGLPCRPTASTPLTAPGVLALLRFMVSAGRAELFVPPQSGVTGMTPHRESRSSELEFESWFNCLLCDLRQVA